MSKNIKSKLVWLVLLGLAATSCGSGSAPAVAEPETAQPEVASEPSAESAQVDAASAQEGAEIVPTSEPSATPKPDPTSASVPSPAPEPTVAVQVDLPQRPFECANLDPRVIVASEALEAELEPFVGPGVPGLVAAVVNSDGLIEIGASGVRSVGADDPIHVTDRLHLGSDTKAMTGALVALLAEEAGIGLDTPLTEIWTEVDDGWTGVTLLDLLHHQGGAEDSLGRDQSAVWSQLWNLSIASQGASPDDRAIQARQARSEFAANQLANPPSETVGQFAYSNAGYMLVGAALEERLGEPWEALMCEHLFKPLAMDGCGFGAPPQPAPTGHTGSAGALTPTDPSQPSADNPAGLGPAGTVHCPAAEWGKFLSWVLRGARGEDPLLSAETWQQLLEPAGEYAAGWLVTERSWPPGPVYTHAGSNTMWFAVAWLAPGIDRAFLAVSNAATPEAQAATDQAIGVLIQRHS